MLIPVSRSRRTPRTSGKFFEDVGNVRHMNIVQAISKRLEESNEESKVVDDMKTFRSKMDTDVANFLTWYVIKVNSRPLTNPTLAHRKTPWFVPASCHHPLSSDMQCTSVVTLA